MKTRKTDAKYYQEKAKQVKSDSNPMPPKFWNSAFNSVTGWYLPGLTTYND